MSNGINQHKCRFIIDIGIEVKEVNGWFFATDKYGRTANSNTEHDAARKIIDSAEEVFRGWGEVKK